MSGRTSRPILSSFEHLSPRVADIHLDRIDLCSSLAVVAEVAVIRERSKLKLLQ